MTKIALVDMDGVLADWIHGLSNEVRRLCEEHGKDYPLPEVQTSWKLLTGNPDADDIIKMGQRHPELYLNLPIIEGAKEGLEALEALGYEVFICSTPSSHNENCASHKLAWVRRELGDRWVDKVILTADKTLVRGDILVDDKPVITGVMKPTWDHIVFDTSYNQDSKGRRLKGWSEVNNLLQSKSSRWVHENGGWCIVQSASGLREKLNEIGYRSQSQ